MFGTYDVLIQLGAAAMGEWIVELDPGECMRIWKLARAQRGRLWYAMRDLGQAVRADLGVEDLSEELSGAIVGILRLDDEPDEMPPG